MKKRFLIALFTGALVCGGLYAQESKTPDKAATAPAVPAAATSGEEVIEWKFKKGDKWFQKLRTTQSQIMKVMNTNVDQRQEQEFVFQWNVEDADATKIILNQKIESVAMKITMSGTEIKYDSAASNAADNPLSSFFKPLIGSSFKVTLDPKTLRVVKIDGREEFVKKLQDNNPQIKALLANILTDEQMKQMTEPSFLVVPDVGKKVKANDAWSRDVVLKMGPIGSFNAKYDYTFNGLDKRTVEGKETNVCKISTKSTLTYGAPEAKDAAGLPFTIVSGKINSSDSSGTIYFDHVKGRVAISDMTVKLKGTLEIKVAETTAPVELDQTTMTFTECRDTSFTTEAAAPPATTPPAGTPPAATPPAGTPPAGTTPPKG